MLNKGGERERKGRRGGKERGRDGERGRGMEDGQNPCADFLVLGWL